MNFCCKLVLYLCLLWSSIMFDFWSRFTETDFACDNPKLPVNQSGVRVLVASMAKTGTRSMSSALYHIGLKNSYHSEDWSMMLWGPVADRYWLKKGGGYWSKLPAPMGGDDIAVLNDLGPEGLAEEFSKCRVDALTFDGIEKMFHATYPVSPDAKVVMLSWRTYEQWLKSLKTFSALKTLEEAFLCSFYGGMLVLPWGSLFFTMDKYLQNRAMEKRLTTGGPPLSQVYDLHASMFHFGLVFRRVVPRYSSGLRDFPQNAEEYYAFYQKIRDMVPPERLFEWDMRKNTYEELCEFVGISPCPRSGLLDKDANHFVQQVRSPATMITGGINALVLHWCNWKVIEGFFYVLSCLLALCQRRAKTD